MNAVAFWSLCAAITLIAMIGAVRRSRRPAPVAVVVPEPEPEPFDWFGNRRPDLKLVHSVEVAEADMEFWEALNAQINDPEGFTKHLGQ